MKKFLFLSSVVVLMLASSCSNYVCPTYSKADKPDSPVTTLEVEV